MKTPRKPQQERSRRTQAALLDAAEMLGETKPFKLISVQEIAAKAGYTIGAFYARFPTKQALLDALAERFTELTQATGAKLRELPAGEQLVECFADALVGAYRERRGLLLLLSNAASEQPQFGDRLSDLRRQVLEMAVENFERAFEAPRPALEAGVLLLVSSLRELYLNQEFWPIGSDRDRQQLSKAAVQATVQWLRQASLPTRLQEKVR